MEITVPLLVAAALAALIGVDRELRGKPAGLRTNIVVAVAAAGFAYAGLHGFGGGDPTRVAAEIVTGVGFLGGGAIFAAGGKPTGLTTAAALWASAAVGLASGIGQYALAGAMVVVTVATLVPLEWLSSRFLESRLTSDARLHVVSTDVGAIRRLHDRIAAVDVELTDVEFAELGPAGFSAELAVRGRREHVEALIREVDLGPDLVLVAQAGEHDR